MSGCQLKIPMPPEDLTNPQLMHSRETKGFILSHPLSSPPLYSESKDLRIQLPHQCILHGRPIASHSYTFSFCHSPLLGQGHGIGSLQFNAWPCFCSLHDQERELHISELPRCIGKMKPGEAAWPSCPVDQVRCSEHSLILSF